MNVLYINPSESGISTAKTATRFGPLDANGLGTLRLDYCSPNADPIQVVDNKFKFVIDLLRGLNPDGTALFPPIYRKEFTDWPWMLNLLRGTRELITYEITFLTPPLNQTSISTYQSYVRTPTFGSVGQQLEIAHPKQLVAGKTATGTPIYNKLGEIQVINNAAKRRVLSGVVAEEGLSIIVQKEIFYELKENGGFFQVKFNDKVVYEGYENTIFPDCPYAPQPKFGVYHHALRTATEDARKLNINAGHKKFEMDMGPVTIIRTQPGEKFPSWVYSLANPRKDSNTLKNLYLEQGKALMSPTIEQTLQELMRVGEINARLQLDLASKSANLTDLQNKYTNLKTALAQLANG
jgi:hypothetical protein